jgi:hypothetical protein
VVPNPVDATGIATASASTAEVAQKARLLTLSDLLSPTVLENEFLKVRIETKNDPLSTLAKPDSSGRFLFNVADVHYSEVMAYQSIQALRRYVQALGFGLDDSRPLYVTVRTKQDGVAADEVNAFYSHNYFDPTAPRTIKLFGNVANAPGQDRLVYWHEFGHYLNEVLSRQVGMDFAGDSGAQYTEAGALHECMADYIAQSVSGTPQIGRWISSNFEGFAPGQPLRSAVDSAAQRLSFAQVGMADGRGAKPNRYGVAEWCSRVLWDIRQVLITENSASGAVKADMLMMGALTLLKRDSSFSGYRNAVLEADQILYCGTHGPAIQNAFSSRGFSDSAGLNNRLTFEATVFGVNSSGALTSTIAAGQEFTFKLKIANPNSGIARNVRVRLESANGRIHTTTYEQGFGDLAASRVLEVGVQNGVPIDHSVFGYIDRNASRGTRYPYKLRLISENAPETVLNGELQL